MGPWLSGRWLVTGLASHRPNQAQVTNGAGAPRRPEDEHGSMTDQRPFKRPVVVQTGRVDRLQIVTNAGMARTILQGLRSEHTAIWHQAIKACDAVIRMRRSPAYARAAFVEAAREARILIDDKPEIEMIDDILIYSYSKAVRNGA